MHDPKFEEAIHSCVRRALDEDLGPSGDVTSRFSIPAEARASARIVAKESGVIAGLPVAKAVFATVDNAIRFQEIVHEGGRVEAGSEVARLEGPSRALLAAERTALNFLQRLSGIATLTRRFVDAVEGTGATILDTRKTTPGLRQLEKYAVRVGGGRNHRFGLYDMILLKENHIAAAGGLREAVERCRKGLAQEGGHVEIEVEVRSLAELDEALEMQVDRIMLDNFPLQDLRRAVEMTAGRVPLEASGGVRLENVRAIAETGVAYISVGALTHSAPALDLSMLIEG
jgi:nicotinate-nucleotide pyrophosphorylase (carboxylating)